MKILCQQTLLDQRVVGWGDIFDSAAWNQIPDVIVNATCVQGMIFTGYDHISIIHRSDGGCEVTEWKDDNSIARTTTLLPYAPDPILNGAINTRISKIVYCEPGLLAKLRSQAPSEKTILRPIADFRPPPGAKVINGIWQTDTYHQALFDVHQAENKGWRDWGEKGLGDGLPVPLQRPLGRYRHSPGTKTFFKTNVARTNTLDSASDELASEQTAGSGTNSEALAGGTDEVIMVWTSPVGEPGAAWPTDVTGQLDIASLGADVDCGFRLAGSTGTGHIARVVTGLGSHVDTKQMSETLFNSPGIKPYTVSGAWAAGDDDNDRLEALLGATRAASHGSQTVEVNTAADSFTIGGWVAAVVDVDVEWQPHEIPILPTPPFLPDVGFETPEGGPGPPAPAQDDVSWQPHEYPPLMPAPPFIPDTGYYPPDADPPPPLLVDVEWQPYEGPFLPTPPFLPDEGYYPPDGGPGPPAAAQDDTSWWVQFPPPLPTPPFIAETGFEVTPEAGAPAPVDDDVAWSQQEEPPMPTIVAVDMAFGAMGGLLTDEPAAPPNGHGRRRRTHFWYR